VKYLLDTHTFIWLNGNPSQLSKRAAALCSDPSNELFLSLASVWEMQIKLNLGRLKLPASLSQIISAQQSTNGIRLLPIELLHILDLASLPNHHNDPFDRLLITQARIEQIQLITDDSQIAKYPVDVVW
jgi:PIN domain nuclease of toxin-antitoxin system